jgi:hypothetical protein
MFGLWRILTLVLIINIPHDVWIVENINFSFNYQHTTPCLDCGEYIYKQLHLGRIHTSLYYLLCNSAPWWWSNTTETCRCYKLRKNIYNLCILLVFISNCTINERCRAYKACTVMFEWQEGGNSPVMEHKSCQSVCPRDETSCCPYQIPKWEVLAIERPTTSPVPHTMSYCLQ